MNTQVATTQNTSVTERLANKFGTTKERLYNVIKSTCKLEKATNEQFEAFLMIAEKYDLNPIMKQIWGYPDRTGGIMAMVSLDGWINIVNNHPEYDGYETSVELDEKRKPISATCTMWRRDRTRPTVKTIYVHEWAKTSSPWQSMPIHFAEMRAFIQCARMCFNISGGIHDGDLTPLDLSPQYPNAIEPETPKKSTIKLTPKSTPIQEPVIHDITDISSDGEDFEIPESVLAEADRLANQ